MLCVHKNVPISSAGLLSCLGPSGAGDRGAYGAQVATVSTIVARLLSAASAADRKAGRGRGWLGYDPGLQL